MNLDAIGLKYGTDKASNGHGYLDIYQEYIEPMVGDSMFTGGGSLLELGWWQGASLRMWREWLPESWKVTGVDIEPKVEIPGVNFIQGDQASAEIAAQAVRAFGKYEEHSEQSLFDVVIDDASHISQKTIQSFGRYWPFIRPGGLYFVEDLQVSYHPDWGGHPHPDRTGRDGQTSMQFLRGLADMVHCGHAGAGPGFKTYTDIAHIAFWPGLCMVKKVE